MAEGDESNIVANIEIPEEPVVINTDFDADYSDDRTAVFKGPMTTKERIYLTLLLDCL